MPRYGLMVVKDQFVTSKFDQSTNRLILNLSQNSTYRENLTLGISHMDIKINEIAPISFCPLEKLSDNMLSEISSYLINSQIHMRFPAPNFPYRNVEFPRKFWNVRPDISQFKFFTLIWVSFGQKSWTYFSSPYILFWKMQNFESEGNSTQNNRYVINLNSRIFDHFPIIFNRLPNCFSQWSFSFFWHFFFSF